MSTTAAWQQHRTSVYNYLRRRLPLSEQAEDLLQETFLRLHRAPPDFTESRLVRAWLLRTARNLVVDFYRARREEISLEAAGDIASTEATAPLRALEPCIAYLAKRLPEEFSVALLLDLDGVPQREIAHQQSVTLSGIKSRIQRARVLLQREFERCCDFHFDQDGALITSIPRRQPLPRD